MRSFGGGALSGEGPYEIASQKVSFSAALQPGMPKTRMVTFQRATKKVRGFLALPRIQSLSRLAHGAAP
jgi:hypothetical protein